MLHMYFVNLNVHDKFLHFDVYGEFWSLFVIENK